MADPTIPPPEPEGAPLLPPADAGPEPLIEPLIEPPSFPESAFAPPESAALGTGPHAAISEPELAEPEPVRSEPTEPDVGPVPPPPPPSAAEVTPPPPPPLPLPVPSPVAEAARALVVGLARTGQAVTRHLQARGTSVVAVEDAPTDEARAAAAALGVLLVERPGVEKLADLVVRADLVVPSPGVPASHPVFGLARAAGVQVRGEVELAARWSVCPVIAVTGTNGKTTVTTLIAEMLSASGVPALAAGNIGLPLCDAVANDQLQVVVAEVSSFQLAFAESFRPSVAVWLNVAADHLDWHGDFDAYVAAKARIWANQGLQDVAVVNADDPTIMVQAARVPSRVVTFGLQAPDADYRVVDGWLRGPEGPLFEVARMTRALPHDLANALAAAAAALAAGATVEGVAAALGVSSALPHRLTLVAYANGVRWYDDSKATNPHAAVAAVRGFDSVVLIAGGRNKGLDLSPLAEAADRIRAVVAIGEAASEVATAFAGLRPVALAGSMTDAVARAGAAARTGDVVLLSPGCASFDWYRSYAERGDDFAAAVHALLEGRHAD